MSKPFRMDNASYSSDVGPARERKHGKKMEKRPKTKALTALESKWQASVIPPSNEGNCRVSIKFPHISSDISEYFFITDLTFF